MTKFKDFKNEILEEIGNKLTNKVVFVEVGNLTSQERPLFRKVITDSDQGHLIIFVISNLCYEDEWRDSIKKAIISSIFEYFGGVSSKKTKTKEEKVETTPTISHTPRHRKKSITTTNTKKKRGRPKGSKNKPKN